MPSHTEWTRQTFRGCSGKLAECFNIRNPWSPMTHYWVIAFVSFFKLNGIFCLFTRHLFRFSNSATFIYIYSLTECQGTLCRNRGGRHFEQLLKTNSTYSTYVGQVRLPQYSTVVLELFHYSLQCTICRLSVPKNFFNYLWRQKAMNSWLLFSLWYRPNRIHL